ncbi:MAG TPA: DUF5985 family protein [Burkholderiaceae bacterium]|nr:DUF5985 family protein [Burkholderiaceae bacterium]
MAVFIYTLCALTALLCAVLLLRAWKGTGARMLMWSGLCFAGLTVNNLLLVIDRVVLPAVDLSLWRHGSALLSIVLLLWGLILGSER